jgi:hypothetical protein
MQRQGSLMTELLKHSFDLGTLTRKIDLDQFLVFRIGLATYLSVQPMRALPPHAPWEV